MAKPPVKDANEEISALKIYNFLQTNHITNEIFLEILSEIKDKHGYKRLKQMVMDLISTHKNALHNPSTERSKRASIINEVCMIAFTIDTVFPSVLRMKVQQEFPKLINDILHELKDEKKIDNFVPYPKPQSSVSTADENSVKRSPVSVNASSPNSDSSKMSYEEITTDSSIRCIASSLYADAVQNKFSNESRTSLQTIQDVRNAYRNVAKKRVTGSVPSFKSMCNIGNSVNNLQLQHIMQEDDAKQRKTDNPVGNENGSALDKSNIVNLQNKKKEELKNADDSVGNENDCTVAKSSTVLLQSNKKKELKKNVPKFNQKVKHLAKISKKREERLKKQERLRLKQQRQLNTLKRIVEEREASDNNPVFTFFKSVAQTVTQFPPNLIAETRVKMCTIVADMEAKVMFK